MISSHEQYEAAYAKASPAQIYLCSRSGNELWAIAQKYSLTNPVQYSTFGLLIGDVILGIQKVSELQPLLIQELKIDSSIASSLARDLLDFLAPLSDPSWQTPHTQKTEDLAAEVKAVEQALTQQYQQAPQPETVYTSTQSAILQEGTQGSQWETR